MMADLTSRRQIMIDIRLVQEIEEALNMDCAPPPDVIAPLAARAGLHLPFWRRLPYPDGELEQDILNALRKYGTWLELDEIYAVQRLRGWHRARIGNVTVTRRHLEDVRWVLGNLRHSLSDECDQALEEYGIDRVRVFHPEQPGRRESQDFREIRNAVLMSMSADDQTCGECNWCWIRRLHITCCVLLEQAEEREQTVA